MHVTKVVFTTMVLFLALLAAEAQSGERKVRRADLPRAVQSTIDTETKGSTIRGYSKEVERGKTYYEVQTLQHGRSRDILIDADGKVVELEEEVAIDSLPSSVKKVLESKAGNGKIGKIESLTKHGKLVAYEATVTKGATRSEIQVGPAGESLSHEE